MYILCKDVVNWEIVTANQRKKYVHDYCDLLIVFGSIIINSFKIRSSPLFTILQNKQVIIVYSFLFVQSNLCIELVNSLVKLTPHPQVGNVLIESLFSHYSPSPPSLPNPAKKYHPHKKPTYYPPLTCYFVILSFVNFFA